MAHFNAAIAIRFTPFFAGSAGWGGDVAKVCSVLGFNAHYPALKEFVAAVQVWQRKHPPLVPDGMLGPMTWKKMGPLAANRGATTFMGPSPAWIAKGGASAGPKKASVNAANRTTSGGPKSDEDILIGEMVKVAMQQRSDQYTPVAVSGAYALDQTKLGVKRNPTGQPISQTLEVGQQWLGIAGPRIIVGLTGSGTFGDVIFVTDSGRIYSQTIIGWESDLFAKLWSDVSKNLRPLKTLLEAEAAFLLGMCAAYSAGAAALVFVGSTTQWMLKNKENMPKYIYSLEQFLEIRSKLKEITPTLYSKLFDIAAKRILAEIPESISKDPVVIARFAGGMLVKVGKMILTRDFTTFWKVLRMELIMSGVRALPGAIQEAISEKDMVEKLKSVGAEITLKDAFLIKEEVMRNGAELKRIADKIEGLIGLFE